MLPPFDDLVRRRGRSHDEQSVAATSLDRNVPVLFSVNVYLSLDLEVVGVSFYMLSLKVDRPPSHCSCTYQKFKTESTT